ncbi:hypothetical protein AA313_de0202994 [Arthrobotrys entomopaga]|nr:hypothetical protein AA313_de0202994 [Arthrobotrys entomopaga]
MNRVPRSLLTPNTQTSPFAGEHQTSPSLSLSLRYLTDYCLLSPLEYAGKFSIGIGLHHHLTPSQTPCVLFSFTENKRSIKRISRPFSLLVFLSRLKTLVLLLLSLDCRARVRLRNKDETGRKGHTSISSWLSKKGY